MKYFIHESSFIDEPVTIGEGTQIWHFSHIMKNARIGEKCKIGQNVVVGPGVSIGNGVKIQNNVSVYPGVTLEDNVFCGPSMVFTNIINPRCEIVRNTPDFFKPTLVKMGATIGANATIMCGVIIGSYAFIGAGAVVTKNVKDHALVYGNPSVQQGWACACGDRLPPAVNGKSHCTACKKMFEVKNDQCSRSG